jgi:DNA-binding GntR family transcriptional regulator
VPGERAHEAQEGGQVTESFGRPAYQQVADDLRRRITAGEFPVGSAIPSTAKLTKDYSVSVTVIRAAVSELRAEGVLAGRPGKGVFVRATPEAAAERSASIAELSEQLEELRAELRRVGVGRHEELAAEVRELRRSVELLRMHVADLYAQLGKPYTGDDAALAPDAGGHAGGDKRS